MIFKNQKNQDNHKNQGSDKLRKYEDDILLQVFWKSIHPACLGRHPSMKGIDKNMYFFYFFQIFWDKNQIDVSL